MPQEQTPQIAYENDSSHKPTILTAILPSPATIYVDNLAKGSRRAMRQALERVAGVLVCRDVATALPGRPPPYEQNEQDRNGNPVADIVSFPWASLRAADTAGLRAELLARYSPAYANKMLSALRGTLREAWRLGQMDSETYHRAVDIENIKSEALPAGRALTETEIRALFDACAADSSPAGTRDAAILGLLIGCGLRRAEIAGLELDDHQAGALTIRQAKRNRPRMAYPTGGAEAALSDWLEIRGAEPGALFWQINKGGRVQRRGLSEQAIYDLLRKRAAQGGVASVTPHDLRRTFVSELLDNGVDIATVQQLVGHANVATTARYDRRPERRKREAARTLNIPYKKGRSND